MIPGMALAAPDNEPKDKPVSTPAIELWADLGLGLISEVDMQAKADSLNGKFKNVLDNEINALTGHLYGFRNVTGSQMSAVVDKIGRDSSFSSASAIGMTKNRAYVEVTFYLTSGKTYVVTVSAPLIDCQPATLKTLEKILATKTEESSKTK